MKYSECDSKIREIIENVITDHEVGVQFENDVEYGLFTKVLASDITAFIYANFKD